MPIRKNKNCLETATHLEFLKIKMCDEIQGFYYYEPMIANDIEILLRGINTVSE